MCGLALPCTHAANFALQDLSMLEIAGLRDGRWGGGCGKRVGDGAREGARGKEGGWRETHCWVCAEVGSILTPSLHLQVRCQRAHGACAGMALAHRNAAADGR